MKYRELKDQRDEALARAIEAERLSMKSEFDRVQAEVVAERECLLRQAETEKELEYERGYRNGAKELADRVAKLMLRVMTEVAAE